jgi:hypothetical protein
MKLKLLWQNGFENEPEKFDTDGFRNLFSAGGISNERGTTWEHEG